MIKKKKRMNELYKRYASKHNINKAGSLSTVLSNADVIVTLTPSTKPLFSINQIKKTAHISAIGADTEGKQEIDSQIIQNCKIIVDDVSQVLRYGELNVPYKKRLIDKNNIYCTLFDIIIGKKEGRTEQDGITLFDSSGLSIQDLIAHRWIFEEFQ